MSVRVVALLLAAGSSSRMGHDRNKLLEPVAGKPLVAWPLAALEEAGVDEILIVVGHEAQRIESVLGPERTYLRHAGWKEGIGSSIAAAARSLTSVPPDAVLVCLGDLPRLRASPIRELLRRFLEDPRPERILLPTFEGRDGHPVLFGASYLTELSSLSGDRGARGLLDGHPRTLERVASPDAGVLLDVDTPEDLDGIG